MKRKLLTIGFLITALLVGYFTYTKIREQTHKILGASNQAQPTPTQESINRVDFDYHDQNLSIVWIQIDETENLTLINNLEKKLPSKEAQDIYNCKILTSSSFYSKDFKPIGLFINDGTILSSWQKNKLFNGVFSINYMEVPRITTTVPKDLLRIAVQSGPVIKENATSAVLSINSDGESRRLIVATTGENKAILLTIFEKDSVFSGPYLSDLPEILQIFEEKTGLKLADALNLDGGSASTFNVPGFNLPAATTTGSFFCLNQ